MTVASILHEKPFAIMDFVCPFTQGRQILNPDYVIFMDTIDKGRYADTNKAFQRPLKNEVDYWVEDQNGELHSEVIAPFIITNLFGLYLTLPIS